MKRGFTLVELLVVVVVIVTLMAIAFRISGAGDDIGNRAKTVNRMQRIENCLSGYYAAYGSYPPVAVHGSRDYRYDVNKFGMQKVHDGQKDGLDWKRVRAACRSQPIAFECPYRPDERENVRKIAEMYNKAFDALVEDSQVAGKEDETDWSEVQICKLGVMGYLLPRLLVLLGGDEVGDNRFFKLLDCAQWSCNNEKPTDFASGQTYGSWVEAKGSGLFDEQNRWKIALLPSQAMCARWIANLEKIVTCPPLNVYGVDINDPEGVGSYLVGKNDDGDFCQYTASGAQGADPDSSGNQYVLKGFTVKDGWGQELYYYSLPPYQSYTLWSSGPNMKTFPPWISDEYLKKLDLKELETAQKWMSDDIVHMKD